MGIKFSARWRRTSRLCRLHVTHTHTHTQHTHTHTQIHTHKHTQTHTHAYTVPVQTYSPPLPRRYRFGSTAMVVRTRGGRLRYAPDPGAPNSVQRATWFNRIFGSSLRRHDHHDQQLDDWHSVQCTAASGGGGGGGADAPLVASDALGAGSPYASGSVPGAWPAAAAAAVAGAGVSGYSTWVLSSNGVTPSHSGYPAAVAGGGGGGGAGGGVPAVAGMGSRPVSARYPTITPSSSGRLEPVLAMPPVAVAALPAVAVNAAAAAAAAAPDRPPAVPNSIAAPAPLSRLGPRGVNSNGGAAARNAGGAAVVGILVDRPDGRAAASGGVGPRPVAEGAEAPAGTSPRRRAAPDVAGAVEPQAQAPQPPPLMQQPAALVGPTAASGEQRSLGSAASARSAHPHPAGAVTAAAVAAAAVADPAAVAVAVAGSVDEARSLEAAAGMYSGYPASYPGIAGGLSPSGRVYNGQDSGYPGSYAPDGAFPEARNGGGAAGSAADTWADEGEEGGEQGDASAAGGGRPGGGRSSVLRQVRVWNARHVGHIMG